MKYKTLFLIQSALALFAGSMVGHAAENLVKNGTFEAGPVDGDWPEQWPKPKIGGSWGKEDKNRFLRLTSETPGTNVMMYHEFKIPEGVKALELKWKQRISNLKVGKQAWFDARIMLEFSNEARAKVPPTPSAPKTNRGTNGWEEKSVKILVPEGAMYLKFMPSLFNVETGTFDLDDIELIATDAKPVEEIEKAKAEERAAKAEAIAAGRRRKAADLLAKTGNLLTNGDFQTDKKGKGWPDGWGNLKANGKWGDEDGNRYVSLISTEPQKTVLLHRVVDIPDNIQALELSWRQRVTNLKSGKLPWNDARIMMEFKDAQGKLVSKPSAPYAQRNTDGWVQKSKQFLVPEGASTLVLMPSLFEVTRGTFDLDDLVLKPTTPDALYAAAEEMKKAEEARYVPFEEADKAKWPLELKVVGNRLQDTNGKEVWLQGVNAGGLETLPHDKQVIKSTVVAVDEWNSNAVRLPVKEEFWFGTSPMQKDGGKEYRETIDQVITLAANRGSYVIIDLHRFRAPKAEHAEFWKDAAKVYKNHPAVLFDLFNEPHGISWEIWKNGGFVGKKTDASDESAFLTAEEKAKNQGFESIGMQALIDAVRSTGAKNIVIAGGLAWSSDLTGVTNGFALDDKGGNGLMYSWHIYNWHKDWEKLMLAAAEKYPILVGELGADAKKMDFIPLEAQEDPFTWVPDMLGFIQKHKLNWTGWCLHPKATPVMISDWNYTPTPYWGAPAKEALAGKQFVLKRMR